MSGTDDGMAHVQLGHTFPYMGGSFTDAWMSSNGFILLYDPVNGYGNSNTYNSGCCSGFNPYGNGSFSFMLAPLWTDLRDPDGSGSAGYYVKTNEGASSFLWYNVYEYGTTNTNTFQANLWPDGSFDFLYDEVNITNHAVWIGFTGHTNVQEDVHELYYGQNGTNITNDTLNNNMSMQLFSGQGYAWWGEDGGYDTALDCSDPLSNTACPGYEQAYYDQQCTMDALYDTQCPGYAEAYFNQQCGIDALYDTECPGYGAAWLDQQCEADPLFSQSCVGYSTALLQQQSEEMISDTSFVAVSSGSDDGSQGQMFEDPSQIEPQTQFTQTATTFTQPETFNEPESFVEVQSFIEPEPEVELVEDLTEEVLVQEETVLETEPEVEILDPIVEEEIVAEVSVDELPVEEFSNEDPAPAKELSVTKQTNVQIALALIEKNKLDLQKRLLSSVSNSQSSQSKSADNTSPNQQFGSSQINLEQYGASSDLIPSEEYSQDSDSVSSDSSQMEQNQGTLQINDVGGITETVATSVSTTSDSSQQSGETTVDFEQESFAAADEMFGTQVNEAFSTGANISTVLSGARPDFSKFDVKPPTKQQAVNTKKVESLAEKMSESAVQQNMEKMQENVQDSGGFNDQTVAVVLINYVPGFDQYTSQSLRSQNQWYRSKSIYKNNGNVDNAMTLYMMAGQTEQKHQQMVLEQYRR